MGYYAYIEIDKTSELSVDNEKGLNVGNPIAALLTIYLGYLFENDKSSIENSWFERLEHLSNESLRLLPLIIYAYDGEISEEEKQSTFLLVQSLEPKLSEEILANLETDNKWKDISQVLIIVNEFNQILPLMGEDTYWYVKENTLPAFITFQETLEKAIALGGKRVRIRFE